VVHSYFQTIFRKLIKTSFRGVVKDGEAVAYLVLLDININLLNLLHNLHIRILIIIQHILDTLRKVKLIVKQLREPPAPPLQLEGGGCLEGEGFWDGVNKG